MIATLWTPRLRLRPIDAGDRALYVALYGDADVMRDIGASLSPERAGRAFDVVLGRVAETFPSDRYWVIERRDRPEDVGLAALQVDGRRGEWGTMLGTAHQGHGYASETLAAISDAALASGAIVHMTIRCSPALAPRIGCIARAGGYRPATPADGLVAWQRP